MTKNTPKQEKTSPHKNGLSLFSLIRWILIIPAAVGTSLFLTAILYIQLIWLGAEWFADEIAVYAQTFFILSHLVFGAGFVYFGTLLAPSNKFRTATVLTGIVCCVFGTRVLAALVMGNDLAAQSGNSLRVGAALITWYLFSRKYSTKE